MALTSIQTSKEFEESYQPLLLVDIVWQARQFGTVFGSDLTLRLSPRSLDPGETAIPGIQYTSPTTGLSFTYSGRILNSNFAAWQVLSQNGIGMSPSLDLEIFDPDLDLWNTYEGVGGPGFKGARVVVKFAFADFTQSPPVFSTNEITVFRGIVSQPRSSDTVLRLNASSMLLMQYLTLPFTRLQKRCPWIHPETAPERQFADSSDSPFFQCGAFTLDSAGNPTSTPDDGSACNHTAADCTRLGRFVHGTVGIGRFGGSTYSQVGFPKQWSGYDPNGTRQTGFNADVSDKYAKYVPIVIGFGWVTCPVTTVYGEVNFTRLEAIYCQGDTTGVSVPVMGYVRDAGDAVAWNVTHGEESGWILTVNNRSLPRSFPGAVPSPALPVTPLPQDVKNGYWLWINHGGREGHACRELGFVPNPNAALNARIPVGDPYGSLSAFYVSINPKAAQSESIPDIRMLGGGPTLRHGYVDPVTHTVSNKIVDPATQQSVPGVVTPWAIEYVLEAGGWTEQELDMASFQAAADKASAFIPYTDAQGNLHGPSEGHPMWKTNLVLEQPQSAAMIVQGLLNNCDGMLVPGGDQLKLVLRETLASQQPNAFSWSNDQTGYTSMLVDGTAATGYYAYVFNESNILQDEKGESTLVIDEHAFEDAPNALSFSFQDEDNQYRQDNLTVVDERDVQRCGMIVPAGMPMLGVPNFDQGFRAAWRRLAQQSRGNPRYEPARQIGTSGTWIARFTTTVKALGIQVGDIIGLRSKRYGLGQGHKPQDFRVTEIKASPDFSEFQITAWWHDDIWHLQTFGQQNEDLYQNPGAEIVSRAPYPWHPYKIQAPDSDPFWPGEYSFGVRQWYLQLFDGGIEAHVKVSGYPPVNQLAPPTTMVPYFSTDPYPIIGGGGMLTPGATYYVAVTARDNAISPAEETNSQSPPRPVRLPSAGGALEISIPHVRYHGGTGHALYAGADPWDLSGQSFNDTTQPTSFTLDTIKLNQFGMPDIAARKLLVQTKRVWHSGVWGQPIDEIHGTNQITILGAGWSGDEWAGRVVSVLGRANEEVDGIPLPRWNFRVLANTSDTLTLSADFSTLVDDQGNPLAPAVNDALIMRAQATAVTATTITDSKWVNSLSSPVMISDAIADPLGGGWIYVTAFAHNFKEGDTIRIFGAETTSDTPGVPTHEMNGTWTIHVFDADHFGLIGSTFVNPYRADTGFAQIQGMRPGEEVGRALFVIAGTGAGQSRRIIDNDATTITLDSPFQIALSAASHVESIFIVEDSAWAAHQESDILSNAIAAQDTMHRSEMQMDVAVPNRAGQMIRVAVSVLDQAERRAPSEPWREIWLFGHMGEVGGGTLVEKDRATFGVGIGAAQTIGQDLTNHFMCRLPNGGGAFIEAIANCKLPDPVATLPLKIDILKAPLILPGGTTHGPFVSVFPAGAPLVIPVNSTEQWSTTTFAVGNDTIDPGDWLRIDLLPGSNQGSQGIEVIIRWGA